MKRLPIVFVVCVALCLPGLAGELQQEMKSRWLGAWIVLDVETYSDCGSWYTNNRVNGNLVKGMGAHPFEPGELAKLDRLDVRRSRLDISLSLVEPILAPHQDGPFTLYRELSCKVELEIEIPRDTVKAKDASAVERALMQVAERHATEAAARSSESWNGRERDAYPSDYEATLQAHTAWKATLNNEAVRAQLELAGASTARLAERVTSDPDYVGGFARGVEDARGLDLESCTSMLAIDVERRRKNASNATPEQVRAQRGFEDGRSLVLGLELQRRLPDCFVPVPDTSVPAAAAELRGVR